MLNYSGNYELPSKTYRGKDIVGDFRGANLRNTDFSGSNWSGADLSGAILDGSSLIGVTLTRAKLNGASLRSVKLRGALLIDAEMAYVKMDKCDARGADFTGAFLGGADLSVGRFSRSKMRNANLVDANLSYSAFRRADLTNAKLIGTVLVGASGPFCIGKFLRHDAVAVGGYITIGCERHTYDEWLSGYEEIGKANRYTDRQIRAYGKWIVMVTEILGE